MTVTKGVALFLTVLVAGVLVTASGSAGPATSTVHLKAISAHATGKGTSLVIEATEPVAYLATTPDPLTVLIDFRNVAADGVANSVMPSPKSPIASVAVEAAESMAAPASRVRVTLAQRVDHRVRSDRNRVVVDFNKPSSKPAPYVLPPASRQQPDAMMALARGGTPAADPIATLGLGRPSDTVLATPAGQAPPRQAAQQAGQQPPANPPAGQPATSQRFTGHPVSLDFQGADLRAVLRTFAEISGLNIVIDPTVQGTVDVALRDVPWDQALDIILRANKLGYIIEGNIVRIAPLTALAAEEKERSDLAKAQAEAGRVETLTKQLSYAKAEDLAPLITRSSLSPRGTVQVDARTNTLIINDLAERLQSAADLISALDKPQPQVEIEARIVQTNKNFERQLGIQWGFNGRVDPQLGNTTNLAFPNNGSLAGRTAAAQGNPSTVNAGVPSAVNLGVGAATSAVGLALGSINGAFNLDVALSALERSGNLRILSTPRVATQNNVEAEMTQGTQIPIQTVANNTVTVTFKDAALTLKVRPQITAAGTVIMNIALENSQADFGRAVNGIPPINTQRANTSVLVSDGETTVIGGVFISNEQYQTDRTPGLGSIPLLRWLFKRDLNSTTDQELVIFITPRIIKV